MLSGHDSDLSLEPYSRKYVTGVITRISEDDFKENNTFFLYSHLL